MVFLNPHVTGGYSEFVPNYVQIAEYNDDHLLNNNAALHGDFAN
jgi:hypothetical protein